MTRKAFCHRLADLSPLTEPVSMRVPPATTSRVIQNYQMTRVYPVAHENTFLEFKYYCAYAGT